MGVGTKSLPCAHIILIVKAKLLIKAKMASMSGVELTDRSKHLYEEIYKGKIDAETIGDLEKTYDEFLVDVKKETDAGKKDCRFAVYDYEYTFLPDGTTEPQWKSKIFLLCWCPDDGPIK